MGDIIRRLREPPFGTETSDRNLMAAAADEIERLRAGGCARDQTTTQFCAEAAALQAENTRLREALLEIFDYECQFSSTSLIACTARDALWPSQLHAALAEQEKKS